jgi:uncharacterized membrane protein YkgB
MHMEHTTAAGARDDVARSREKLVFGWFDERRTERLAALGRGVLRYAVVLLLLLFGALKFTELEAQGIRPLVEHHPLMRFVYLGFGVRGGSAVIGVIELVAAVLMSLRRYRPALSALGSLLAAATFTVTVSFLATTPGVFAPDNPFGGFLMKDVVLLGAALYAAAEALGAARRT